MAKDKKNKQENNNDIKSCQKRAGSLFQATKKKILTLLQNTYERPMGIWKLKAFATKNYNTSDRLCSGFERKLISYKVKLRLYYYWKNKPATNGINRMTYLSVTAWNALPVNNLKRTLYLDTGAFKVSAQYKLT